MKTTCDRCGEPKKKLVEHETERSNDGKGTPMRPARYCSKCLRESKSDRRRAEKGIARKKKLDVPEVDVLIDMLSLVHAFDMELSKPEVEKWSDEEKVAAEKWAAREVAITNDHGGKRLPMPDCVERLGKLNAVAREIVGSPLAESIADSMEEAVRG